jgi:hypothetical protein
MSPQILLTLIDVMYQIFNQWFRLYLTHPNNNLIMEKQCLQPASRVGRVISHGGKTMNENTPLYVALLFILRCLVPLAILFGISYLLRKLGLVVVDNPEPPDEEIEDDENVSPTDNEES